MIYGADDPVVAQRQRLSFGGYRTTIGNPLLLSSSTLALNQWYHVAVTRQNGVFRMFIDGQLEATATKSVAVDFSLGGTAIGINGWNIANNTGFFVGHIDEMRITKGRARYTTAFTPPGAPFSFGSS